MWARHPLDLALKPDGGELVVTNFDSDNISIIETSTNEVGGSYLIGTQPARGLVTSDNSRLYVSNFGSNTIAVYDIDIGKLIAIAAGGQSSGWTGAFPKRKLFAGAGFAVGRRDGHPETKPHPA